MLMKKIVSLFVLLLMLIGPSYSQSVESSLRKDYSSVQYQPECGGWYLISEEKNGQTLYGFADSFGNIIASGGTRYKIYPGFIELYQLDTQKKSIHDQWEVDMIQYNKDYAAYKSVKVKYENELAAYEAKVEAAEVEAKRRWKAAQKVAEERAEREAQALQQQTSGSILGAVLGGIAGGISVASAVAAVKYEPFLNQVLSERDLLVEPYEPYNPRPTKPLEPETGWYWGRYSLRQPCTYEYIDYDKITEIGTFADVKQGNYWGLVDAYMNEVVPCTNNSKVMQGKVFNNYLVKKGGLYGVIDSKSNVIIPIKYNSIIATETSYMVKDGKGYGLLDKNGKVVMPCVYQEMKPQYSYLLCKKDGKWGVFTSSYNELYPCQYQEVSLLEVEEKLVLMHKDKGLWGVIDFNSGMELLPVKYEKIDLVKFEDRYYYIAVEHGLKGLYTVDGVLIVPCNYSDIECKSVAGETLLEVKCKDGAIGLVHMNGIDILEPGKYTSYEWFWLSSKERFVRPEKSDYTLYASSYYKVKSKATSLYGVCNKYGQELIPCVYTDLRRSGNYFLALKVIGGKRFMGCVSYLGQELFPFVEAKSLQAYNDYCEVFVSDRYGAIDYHGNVLIPFKKKDPYSFAKKINKKKIKNSNIETVAQQKADVLNADYKKSENMALEQFINRRKFSFFAQNYVERIINDWQKKGEFEKIEAWKKRVNNNTMQQKVYLLTKEAQEMFINEKMLEIGSDVPQIVGNYDPDNETFRVDTKYSVNDILVHVSPEDAQEFKNTFGSMRKLPKFFIDNDNIALSEYVFAMPDGRMYVYSDSSSLKHMVATVDYNFDLIEIDKSSLGSNKKRGHQIISTGNFAYGTSDVDINIPSFNRTSDNTFVVIIANENYDNEKNVDFAFNDGQVFRDYCIKMLGVPMENIHFRSDATLNNIKYEVNWVREVSKVNDNAQFIFYYAGHGAPDEANKDAYLLPVDGFVEDVSTGYKLSELYTTFGELSAENVLVILDACFTGTGRDDEMLANVRGVRITPKNIQLKGNVVVFAATSNNQTAHPYTEESHGLFTYYLLKGMQQADASGIKLGDLFSYVKTEVAKKSLLIKSKSQTPTVIVSPKIADNWMKFNM